MKKIGIVVAVFLLFAVGVTASTYYTNPVTAKINVGKSMYPQWNEKTYVNDNDKMLPLIMVQGGTVIKESDSSRIQRELNLARKTIEWGKAGRIWDTETNKFINFPIFEYHSLPTMNDIEIVDGKVIIKGYDGPWAKVSQVV